MTFALAPEAEAAGYRVEAFDTIGSTSDEAAGRVRQGEGGPLWIVSAHQSAGRGRRGAAWATPPGNLAASLLLTTDRSPADVATLGFVAGVALVRALDEVTGMPDRPGGSWREELSASGCAARFALKWPNDVLVGGQKLAGILLGTEEAGSGGGRAVVVGIGVNVRHAPSGLPYPAASLATISPRTGPEAVFTALSRWWMRTYERWRGPDGFAAVREEWLGRAAGIGGEVSVRTGDVTVGGRFETLDGRGHLVLRVPDGSVRTVSAGEVHFGSAATARAEHRA